MALGVFISSRMTALTLDSGNRRLQVSRDGRSVTGKALLQIAGTLAMTERCNRVRGCPTVLSDGYPVLVQLGEITDARFENAVLRSN